MRTVLDRIRFAAWALAALVSFFPLPASGLGCSGTLGSAMTDAQSKITAAANAVAGAACTSSACTQCQTAVKGQKEKLIGDGTSGSIPKAIQTDNNITSACGQNADGTAAVGNGTQQNSFFSSLNVFASQSQLQKQYATENASGLQKELAECQKQLKSGCETAFTSGDASASAFRPQVEKMFDACKAATTSASTVAGTDAKDGLNLGTLAQTLGAGASMLGAAAQLASLENQLNSQGGSGSGLSGQTDGSSGMTGSSGSGVSGSSGQPSDSLAANQVSPGTALAAVKPAGSATAASQAGPAGFGTGAGQAYGSGASSPLGNEPGSAASAGAGSASPASGNLANAAGASHPSDAARAPASGTGATANAPGYEVSGAGGMVSRAGMMGLKPGNELADASPEAAPAALPATGAEGLGAAAANGDAQQMAAAEEDPAESIFLRVRSRYANLTKMGRF